MALPACLVTNLAILAVLISAIFGPYILYTYTRVYNNNIWQILQLSSERARAANTTALQYTSINDNYTTEQLAKESADLVEVLRIRHARGGAGAALIIECALPATGRYAPPPPGGSRISTRRHHTTLWFKKAKISQKILAMVDVIF